MSAALAILAELRERGVALRVVGDRLRYRPLQAVTPELRERMVACRAELIEMLTATEPVHEYGNGDRPTVSRCPVCHESDFMRPRQRGTWCCARCHPYESLKPSDVEWWPRVTTPAPIASWMLKSKVLPRACTHCGSTSLWRLKAGGWWVCARCHPPQPTPELIETVTVAETAPAERQAGLFPKLREIRDPEASR